MEVTSEVNICSPSRERIERRCGKTLVGKKMILTPLSGRLPHKRNREKERMMSEERTTLYTARVSAGKNTFFIDGKQAKNNHYYITITDSRRQDDGTFEQKKVIVFQESFKNFREKITEVCEMLEKLYDVKRDEEIAEARKTNPRAFMKWETEEEEKLEKQFKKGLDMESISKAFGRSSGALLARLERLGLIQPEASGE